MKTVIIKNSIVEELTNGKKLFMIKKEYEKNKEILIQKLYKVIDFMPNQDLAFVYERGDYDLIIRSLKAESFIDGVHSIIDIDIKFNKKNMDYSIIYDDANKLILKEIAEVDKLITGTVEDKSEVVKPTIDNIKKDYKPPVIDTIYTSCLQTDRVSEFADKFINELLMDISKISAEDAMYNSYNELISALRKEL